MEPIAADTSVLIRGPVDDPLAARKEQFKLAFLEKGGMITHACRAMTPPLSPHTARKWLENDPNLKAWFEEEFDVKTDDFVQEFELRALTGLTRTGLPSKMSDRLLQHAVTTRQGSPYRQTKEEREWTFRFVREEKPLPPGEQHPELPEGAVDAEYSDVTDPDS